MRARKLTYCRRRCRKLHPPHSRLLQSACQRITTSYARTHTHQYNSHHDVTWHEDNWSNGESRFLAWTLHDTQGAGCGDVYFAFNAHAFEVRVALPPPPPGQSWRRVVDTNLPPPRDFTPGGNAGVEAEYGVAAHAAIMLASKPLQQAAAAEPAAAA